MFKYLLIALVALSIFQTDGFAQEADCPPHQSGAQPVSLISGFDDVLRQARNQGMLPSVEQFFHPDYTFAGMRELYSELTAAEPGPVKFNLLSGFPSWGKHRVAKFLSGAQFPKSRLTL